MILIVGAGIAGSALAVALRRRGIPCELIERESVWTTVGAGITLYPNGMRALRSLGLADAVRESGAIVTSVRTLTREGELVAEIPGENWPDMGPMVAIHRPRLQALLVEAVAGVPVRLGTSVSRMLPDRDGVDVAFSDGSEGRYELVIGADGIRSCVREACFAPSTPRYVGQMYWRGMLSEPVVACATLQFAQDRFVALVPLGGDQIYVAAQLHTRIPLSLAAAEWRAALEARFGDFGAPARDALLRLEGDLHFGPVEEIARAEWRAGRVLLVGDAAHACSPVLTQGGSLAIEDAVLLAELLAGTDLAASDPGDRSIDAALEEFVARREPRARWVRERTRYQIQLMNRGSPPAELGESLQVAYSALRAEI
jgi:2-polyprenyl-6-methoxyphenol hydroxylase-like FAD-dependent oxidoreductase